VAFKGHGTEHEMRLYDRGDSISEKNVAGSSQSAVGNGIVKAPGLETELNCGIAGSQLSHSTGIVLIGVSIATRLLTWGR
jgi:hypothetical protein